MRSHVALILLPVLLLLRGQAATLPDAEFPVQFRGGLLWAEIHIPQSSEPLHFLVDSGASVSVLNLGTARRLGLTLGPTVEVTAVGTNVQGHWPVKLAAKASQIALPVDYLAMDLTTLSLACSHSVDGLIGADFFRERIVEIDYVEQRIRLLGAAPSGLESRTVRLRSRPGGFQVAVQVNGGRRQWVRVDTGCATPFQWVTSKAPSGRAVGKMAVGVVELAIHETTTAVQIGNHHFAAVPTGLHRSAIFSGESGLLGNGLLARFGVVTIDARGGRLILGPP